MVNCIKCGKEDEFKQAGEMSPVRDIHIRQLCDSCKYTMAKNWDVPIKNLDLVLSSIKHDKYLINKLPEEKRLLVKAGRKARVKYFAKNMFYFGEKYDTQGFIDFIDNYNEEFLKKYK